MLPVFPVTAVRGANQRISLAGHDLFELAQQYGTPLYVYDAATIQRQVQRLHHALTTAYPGQQRYHVCYARHTLSPGLAPGGLSLPLCIDAVSLGELNMVRAAFSGGSASTCTGTINPMRS
jgi:diaminopimelate decarboxylase